jgi:hypothetical protein
LTTLDEYLKLFIMNHTLIATVLSNAGYNRPDVLATIIGSLNKPDVAVSMLLGVHQPIEHCTYYKRDSTLYVIDAIDEIKNVVSYSYARCKTQYVYYLTKDDRTNNVYTTERPKGDYYTTGEIPVSGVTFNNSSDSVDDFFRRNTPVTETEYYQTLDEWQNAVVTL